MANPLYGQNKADDAIDAFSSIVNGLSPGSTSLRVQRFNGSIAASSTTDLDFTPDQDTVTILGGYVKFEGLSGSADMDIDITAAHSLLDTVTSDGIYNLGTQYIASGEVIRIDPQTASDTKVYVEVVLITCKLVTS
jgi:hypothetical protein|tara:strand:- start:435 stop:842 length:408 start_codon:yes stop_codon:yes gene_type:complete